MAGRDFFDVTLDDIPQSDAAICYYVSGYIARRIGNQRKCSSCKELLISSYCASDVADNLPEEHEKLFEMANRGGLSEPSTFCFAVTIVAMQYFTAVASNCEDLKKLLSLNNPRAVFAKASSAVVKSRTSCDLTNVKCSLNHLNFKLIVHTSFNCFAKNQLQRLNSRPSLDDPPQKSLRKIQKLTSKTCN